MASLVMHLIFVLMTFESAMSDMSYTLTDNILSTSYKVESGSKLWLEGSSNVNQFRFDTEAIKGSATLVIPAGNKAHVSDKAAQSGFSAKASIPVKSLDSNNKRMNSDMYEAMKADKHEDIQFELLDALLHPIKAHNSDWFSVSTLGKISLAGVTDSISMDIQVRALGKGKFQLRGQKQVRMTDFGIKPPSVFWGLIKANDEIVIHFDMIGAPQLQNSLTSDE